MSDAGKNYSREPQEITIAPGKKHPFQLNCDWFVIDRCQVATEAGADVTLYAAINDRRAAPIRRGEPGAAVNLGQGEIKTVEVENRTASDAFVRIIYGYGSRPYSPETVISNPSLALDSATIAALATAYAAAMKVPRTLKAVLDRVTGTTTAFVGGIGLTFTNDGDGDAILTAPGGLNATLSAGTQESFSVEDDSDVIETITVNATAAGASVKVTGLKL